MEANVSGETRHFCRPTDPRKSLEWDLNDWKWDGDLFVATPLNAVSSDCHGKGFLPVGPAGGGISSNCSSSCSDETNSEKGKTELEKRRRLDVVEEEELNNEAGSLALKLGGHIYPGTGNVVASWEAQGAKKSKLQSSHSNRSICQVENCGADLSNAKDYHRRHKVCEMHAKASNAVVGNAVQRFCQQCSRFHLLQEFDEGKRSCRRRLAGHNKRRRKTHPDALIGGEALNDEQAGSYLLINLLRILSNLHSNSPDKTKDEDLLSKLLRSLAGMTGTLDGRSLAGLLPSAQHLQTVAKSVATDSQEIPPFFEDDVNYVTAAKKSLKPSFPNSNMSGGTAGQDYLVAPVDPSTSVTVAALPDSQILETVPNPKSASMPLPENGCSEKPENTNTERLKLSNIDLNDVYNEPEDCIGAPGRSSNPANMQTGSIDYPAWGLQDNHQSSPPQASGNSDSASASAQSPSSSNGDAQSRTGRIVFKLFGKHPSDFPLVLRAQILDWLSHTPTDIESYIRPGCVVLTIYVRLPESTWDELSCNLTSSLNKLLDVSNDSFWQTGWMYAKVQQQIAFICNGQVVLNTRFHIEDHEHDRISGISPIALSLSDGAVFRVKGYDISRVNTRLLCAFGGNYVTGETSEIVLEGVTNPAECDEPQCLSFACPLPCVTGRGFIEVEDDGVSCGFFPFIVAEEDICSEIRVLERLFDVAVSEDDVVKRNDIMKTRNQALEFLHEMGWLLRRSHLITSTLGRVDSHTESFSLQRFKWLMEFSIDHDWCSVVKKLLDILIEGTVDVGGLSSVEVTLSKLGLLHRAVRRNCRLLVVLLLRYVPDKRADRRKAEYNLLTGKGSEKHLFRPDMPGPGGVTPLHIAASRDDAEIVLEALTDDPGQVGIDAWRTARDNSGFTPQDYARLRGHYSYIHLVQRKTNMKADSGHVVVEVVCSSERQPQSNTLGKLAALELEKRETGGLLPNCKICSQQLLLRRKLGQSLAYRPAMLSLVAIAAVCVCLGILFKGPPEVMFVFPPFRWERLKFGPI